MYKSEKFYKGAIKISVAIKIRTTGIKECSVVNFLEAVSEKERKIFEKRIEKISNNWPVKNTKIFKPFQGFKDFYEVRYKRFRIFALFVKENKELILLEGKIKKKRKFSYEELNRIYKKYREEFL